ncbi:MAG: response regulator [Leptolyngbyaceae bacterium]|nr:response regulator [Leptolyngbyaceae bacterium]
MALSPTTAYYIRRLLRQNLDQLQPIASKRDGINIDPMGDLNTVITKLYHDPKQINATIFELERLVTFHQGLSGQESAHDKEIADVERRLLWLLGFSMRAPSSRGKILLVDDTPESLLPLTKVLTNQKYEVSSATSGPTALQLAQEVSPDLIFLDIRMPGMDGYEVCQRLKTMPVIQDIPILFVSASDDVVDKVKAFKLGGADYVTKPFQIEEVLARVHYQLKIRELQHRLEAKSTDNGIESGDRPTSQNSNQSPQPSKSPKVDLNAMIHNLPVVIHQYILGDTWKTLYMTDTIQHLVGFPPTRFIDQGRCWTELIHPVDREAVRQRIMHAIQKRMPYALEFRVVHKNSSVRWVYQQGAVVIAQDGSVKHINSSTVDISPCKSGAASL